MKVELVDTNPLSPKHRDALVVQAVEGVRNAQAWWAGRQQDTLVVALRDEAGIVSVFDAVLRRAVELDASEGEFATPQHIRAALDKVCS